MTGHRQNRNLGSGGPRAKGLGPGTLLQSRVHDRNQKAQIYLIVVVSEPLTVLSAGTVTSEHTEVVLELDEPEGRHWHGGHGGAMARAVCRHHDPSRGANCRELG